MKRIIGLFFTLITFISSQAVTKIACVGSNITYGTCFEDRENNSFPGQLQSLLGEKYLVLNFEVGGCTMLRKGNSPYWETKEYREALNSCPDIVFIDLGRNDSKLINRPHLDEINNDCQNMIDAFQQLTSHPRVIVLLPVVSFVADTTGIWDPAIVHRVIPGLQQAAYEKEVELLDLHQQLINHEELFQDKIHLNKVGSAIIAKRLFEVIRQQRDEHFDILSGLPQSSIISSFNGYQCADFTLDQRSCKVVKPKWSAKGHPWIWRSRFWAHEPQTDIALLERGFHLVYCDPAELYGNDELLKIWGDFYSVLHKAGLSEKAVMEGMSRGAVDALNWAAENPGKVNAVYIDNPILDMKSVPCGLGKLAPVPDFFEIFKRDYKIISAAQLKSFKNSPIDKVKQIVNGHYPILILCADADEIALPEENTLPFEQKIISSGGNITVIHKPGFAHHPHSFPNPELIVDFIMNAIGIGIVW